MSTLFGTKIKDTYDGLLKVSDNIGITSTKKLITDGLGNDSSVYISDEDFQISTFFYVDINSGDPSTSKIGIGTSSPSYSLHVVGNIYADTGWLAVHSGQRIYVDGAAGKTYITGTDTEMSLYSAGAERIHINATGTGLGTSSPSQVLHVVGNARVTGKYYDSGNSAGTSGQILSATGSGTDWVTLSEISGVDGSGTATYLPIWTDGDTIGDSIISSANGDVTINGSDDNPVLYINPSGGDMLDTASIIFNSRGMVGWDGWVTLSDNGQNKDIRLRANVGNVFFQTNNTTRMLIAESTGNVGINTTSPSVKLEVLGDINAKDSYISCGLGATDGYQFHDFGSGYGLRGVTGGVGSRISIYTNAVERFYIDASGNTTFAGDVTFSGGVGAVNVVGSGNQTIQVGSTSGGYARIYLDGMNGDFSGSDYVYIGQDDDGVVKFHTNSNAGNTIFYSKNSVNLTMDGANSTFAGNVTLGSSSKASDEWMYIDSDSNSSAGIQLLRGGLSKWFIYNPGGTNNFKIYDNSGGGYFEMAVGGAATFSGAVTIPETPTADTHAASKGYVDSEIEAIPSGLNFQGNWNADTNDPTLASGTGTVGHFYNVSVEGTTNLDGITDWKVGDWAVFVEAGGTDTWKKIDNTSVLSGVGSANRLAYWSNDSTLTFDLDFYVDGDTIFTTNLEASNNIVTGGYLSGSTDGLSLRVGSTEIADFRTTEINVPSVKLVLNSSIDVYNGGSYWSQSTNSSGKYVFKQGSTQRGIWSSGELELTNDLIVGGNIIFSSGSDIIFPDNGGAALEFKEGSNLYMRFVTTNGSEGINMEKATTISNSLAVNSLNVNYGALSISGDNSNHATFTESGSGDFTIESVDDLRLDSGGNDIVLRGASSAEFGRLTNDSQNFIIRNITGDKDIIFRGKDDTTVIDALTLDMSDAGNATFAGTVTASSYFLGSASEISLATTGAGTVFLRPNGQSTSGQMKVESTGNATFAGSVTGTSATFNGGITIDGIYIDGTEIDLSSGTLTFDADAYSFLDGDATFAGNVLLQSDAGDATKSLSIYNEGTATGDDVAIGFKTHGSRQYSIGIDRSVGDFVLTTGYADVGSGVLLSVDTSGNATFAGNVTVGGGQILTPSATNLALNPNTGIVSIGGVVQASGTGSNTFAGNISMTRTGSGDQTLTIKTTTGGDPTIILNSAAANRSGLIRFYDNGTNMGTIIYNHNGDTMDFYTGGTGSTHLDLSLHETDGATFRTKATFGGDVIVDGSNGVNGIKLLRPSDSASMTAISAPDSSTLKIGGGNQSYVKIFAHTTEAVSFNTSGNATFTGNITTQTDSSVLGGSGVVPLYVRSTGTVSYVQIQTSTTGSNTTSDGLTVGVNGSTAYIWQRENANLHLGTNDTSALLITSSQNVGIGTTSPVSHLEIAENTVSSNFTGITVTNSAGASSDDSRAGIAFKCYDWVQSAIWHGRNLSGNLNGALVLGTNPDTSDLTVGGVVGRLHILNNGKVQLNAYGSGTFTGTATQRLAVDSSGNIIELAIGSGAVDGGGTANTVTMWSDADTLTDAPITISGNNATFTGKILAGSGATAAATINAFSTEVSSNLFSALRIISQPSASNYWDIGATGGSSTLLNFYHNATTTPKISFTHLGGATFSSNVGIGTTSPTGKLEIQNAQITNQADRDCFLRLHPSATTDSGGFTNMFFGTSTTNNYGVAIGGLRELSGDGEPSFSIRMLDDAIYGTEVLNINSTGNATFAGEVTSKGLKLTANTTLYPSDASISYYSSTNAVYVNGAGNNGWLRLNASGVSNDNNAINIFGTNSGSYQTYKTANVERMRIDGSGNIGIGTTSPDSLLHIYKATAGSVTAASDAQLVVENSGVAAINLLSPNTSHGQIIFGDPEDNDAGQFGYDHATNGMYIKTNGSGSKHFFVSSSGNVGIGTSSPDTKTHIQGASAVTGAFYDSSTVLTVEDTNPYLQIIGTDGGNQASTLMLTTVPAAGSGDNKHWAVQHRGTTQSGNFGISYDTTTASGQDGADGTDLFVIETGGNVGIGTSSPSANLEVAGDVLINSGEFISWGGVGETSIEGSTVSNKIQFKTGSGNRMIINNTGVGIGTTSPGSKLDVNGATYVRNVIYGYAGAGNQYGGLSWGGTDEGFLFLKDSNVTKVNINSNGNSYLNGGNVGIGTTAPVRELHIKGPDNAVIRLESIANTDATDIEFYYGSARMATIGSSSASGIMSIYTDTTLSNGFRIGTNSTERLRIDFAGNVGIGTNSPTAKLKVVGENDAWTCQIENTQALPYGLSVNTAGTAGTTHNTAFYTHSGTGMFIRNDGLVGIGTNSPSSKFEVLVTSDHKYVRFRADNNEERFKFYVGASGNSSSLSMYDSSETQQVQISTGGNSYFNGGLLGIGTTSPDRTLDVEGDGMSIFGSGGYTELMLRGQVEGTGTVRNVGSWHWSLRSDVGGDNDDLKLLRFVTGSYNGISLQFDNTNGNATFEGEISASDDINTTGKLFVNKTDAELRLKTTNNSTGTSLINFADPDDNDVGQIKYDHNNNEFTFRSTDALALTLDYDSATFAGNIVLASEKQIQLGSSLGGGDYKIYWDGTDALLLCKTGDLKIMNQGNDKDIYFQTDDGAGGTATYMIMDGSQAVEDDQLWTIFPDKARVGFGTDKDLQLHHESGNNWIINTIGNLTIRNTSNDGDIIFESDDGSGGYTAYLTLDGSQTNIHCEVDFRIYDDKKLQLGNGADLEIYHDGTDSYINNNTGILNITNNDIRFKTSGAETMLRAVANGAVELMYDNSTKIATTSGGVDCSGYYGFTSTGNDYGFYYGVEPGATQGIAIKVSDTGGAYFDGVGYFWNENTGDGAGMFQMQNDGNTYCRYLNFFRGGNDSSDIIGWIGYNATNTATTFSTSSSDERLKKNIVDWNESVLPKFLALEPKQFHFNKQDDSEEKNKGYIAQKEVDNFPEVYQLDGEDDDARYGFHPMEMTPYLMKAIKELVEKNKELENRLEALEN